MKGKIFYINAPLDFNDLPLKPIFQKPLSFDEELKVFQTLMQKSIKEEELFRLLLEDAEIIDFDLEADKEGVSNLRMKLKNATDFKSREVIEREIQKKAPKSLQKYVIIIRNLLALTEKKGFGMGISNGDFYYYNGRYWDKKEKEIVMGFLGDFAEACGLENLEAQQFKVKEHLIQQFQTSAPIPDFNAEVNEIRIPLLNGTLILKDGMVELVGFKKEHFLKYQLSFKYDITAAAPLFQKFLDRVLPQKELQNILLEYLGYLFLKEMKLQKMLVLYGFGRNGKSVVNDIICALLGNKNITNFTLTSLCDVKSQTRPFLENMLLNFAQEIGSGNFDADLLKTLSSNQPVEVKKLYQNPFIMTNYARLAFNTNTLPKYSENTDAYFNRFLIIPFKERISDEEMDIELANKIIENELPGVFNMVIEGMQRLKKQGNFTKSRIVDQEIEKYRKESNSVLSFIDDENYIKMPVSKMELVGFYQLYKDYCISNGFHACQIKNMSAQLRNAGFEIKRSNNGFFYIFYDKLCPGADNLTTINPLKEKSIVESIIDDIINPNSL